MIVVIFVSNAVIVLLCFLRVVWGIRIRHKDALYTLHRTASTAITTLTNNKLVCCDYEHDHEVDCCIEFRVYASNDDMM